MSGAKKRDEHAEPLREEAEDVAASPFETRPWQARRARVTTLKSMEPVRDAELAPSNPVRIEQAAPLPPRVLAAAPSENVVAPPPSAVRKRLPRNGLVFVAVAVAAVGLVHLLATSKSQTRPVSAARTVEPSVAHSAPTRLSPLHLRAALSPSETTATLDGRPIEARGGIDQKLELDCPRGHHVLRFDAPGHHPVEKRVPCAGIVLLDVALEALD
jgi:hypothetical protein